MIYSSDFRREQQSSRFDRWRIDYDLLFRVIEAKEELFIRSTSKNNQDNAKAPNQGRVR